MPGDVAWDEVVDLACRVIDRAVGQGITLACAESCTGGMVSVALTSVAGSSAVFRGGIVSYDPAVKHDVLGVSRSVIDAPGIGVVSAECARMMANGARHVCRAGLAVSTTGIAGPTGAEPGKPVGTVYVGLSRDDRSDVTRELAVRHEFSGDRAQVRLQACRAALLALLEAMLPSAGGRECFDA